MELGIADWSILGTENKTRLLILPVVGEWRRPDGVNCRHRFSLRTLRLSAGGCARPPTASLERGRCGPVDVWWPVVIPWRWRLLTTGGLPVCAACQAAAARRSRRAAAIQPLLREGEAARSIRPRTGCKIEPGRPGLQAKELANLLGHGLTWAKGCKWFSPHA
jgi:hypothetical protein